MRFTALLHGREISGDVVNPGDFWGDVWVIEVGLGNGSFFKAVESRTCQDALDVLTDDEKHGACLRMVDEGIPDEEKHYAGNAGTQIDLENVAIHHDYVTDLFYLIGDDDPTVKMTPKEYDWREV